MISHTFDSLNLFLPTCLSFVEPSRLQESGSCKDGYLMKQVKTLLRILDLDTLEVSSAYSFLLCVIYNLHPLNFICFSVESSFIAVCRS